MNSKYKSRDLEGTVTKVNFTYCYVVLYDCWKLHFGNVRSNIPTLQLPEVGTKVHYKNCYGGQNVFALTKNSVEEGSTKGISMPCNAFVALIKTWKMTEVNLVEMDPIIKMLEENFPEVGSSEYPLRDILFSLYGLGIFSSPAPFPVSHFKRVEIMSDKYKDFPYWSFGAHHECTELFGYLYFDTSHGLLMLKDSHHLLPLIIQNASEYALEGLLDCYVTVRGFKIFTEIYSEPSESNVEYVVAAFSSINVASQRISEMQIDDKPPEWTSGESICFTVSRKSTTRIGDSKSPEIWFEIFVCNEKDPAVVTETRFLIFPEKHMKVASLLHECRTYKLFHNVPLQVVKETTLSRFKPYKIFKLSTNENFVYFQILKTGHKNLLSVKECKKHIETSSALVSFEGVLVKRMFNNPLYSRKKSRTNLYGYGTPGVKTHYLVFTFTREQGNVAYLDCYLNDWEDMMMPLGLLPSMRVRVNHMLPASRRYLKSTPFTSFEIVAYEAPFKFQTVNLYVYMEGYWGKNSFLGKGHEMPYGVLIWGRVYSVEVLSVEIRTSCKNCKNLKGETERATHAQSCPKDEVSCFIKMMVEDQYGQSKILAKSLTLLRMILDVTPMQFKVWLKGFKEIGYFKFSIWDEQTSPDIFDTVQRFKAFLRGLLRQFNDCAIVHFELKCRLLNSSVEKNQGKPLWFLIDARKDEPDYYPR